MNRFPAQFIFSLLVASNSTFVGAVTVLTVPIADPGNAADTRSNTAGFGSVGYSFRIGKTEITNAQYAEFLNAVAASDPLGLYNGEMGSRTVGGIVRSGASGNFNYSVKAPALGGTYTYEDKPVVEVSWYDAARFSNWLHNGQLVGVEGPGTTETGAYTLLGGTPTPSNANSITRNPNARWWVPSENEWYKAAYYYPITHSYYDYPTGNNSVPNNNPPSFDTGNSANFYNGAYTNGNPNYPLTNVGAYTLSPSRYSTFDQGGNVFEWNEIHNGTPFSPVRGGAWTVASYNLNASTRYDDGAEFELVDVGFRVASVPEPASISLCFGGVAIMLLMSRRVLCQGSLTGLRPPLGRAGADDAGVSDV